VRIYLDTSVLNRPFDDQTQPRIWLETQAISLVLGLIRSGELDFICSSAVSLENGRCASATRRAAVARWLERATAVQRTSPATRLRVRRLTAAGMTVLDAAHVALAEEAGCDYLLTCDDGLLRRRSLADVAIVDPVEFVASLRRS
jgi:predicted nucleic acid-binding protein